MLKFLISEAQMRVRALLSIAMTDVTRLKRGKWDTHSDPWVFVPLGVHLVIVSASHGRYHFFSFGLLLLSSYCLEEIEENGQRCSPFLQNRLVT